MMSFCKQTEHVRETALKHLIKQIVVFRKSTETLSSVDDERKTEKCHLIFFVITKILKMILVKTSCNLILSSRIINFHISSFGFDFSFILKFSLRAKYLQCLTYLLLSID